MATKTGSNRATHSDEKAKDDHRQKRHNKTRHVAEEETTTSSPSSDDERKTSHENRKSQSSRRSSYSTTTKTLVNDPHLERKLDRPCTIQFELPLRSVSSVSSLSSITSSDSSSSSSSSSCSLFDSSSDTESDANSSRRSSARSRSQSSDEEFDPKTWFEKDMMELKHDLRYFRKEQPLILYHEWNAKVCRNQFRALNFNDPSYDKRRRLLNVTVMATTDRAIVKGKYLINKETVEFNFPSRMKTILYEHMLKSHSDDDIKVQFQTTEVNVVNEDCVKVMDRLMNEGYDPVMLNMANAISPGGGFRTGASAQEEDLFRRSIYSRSLDINFAETADPTHKRLHYKPSGDCKSYPPDQSMYPLEDFDAIYTSGLCFFRRDKDHGYAFMEEPLYDVCAIAMAATKDPPIEDGQLTPEIAKIMTKKVETIFGIAQNNKHDCLVLSAFGCGAFHNPPEHVANIFKSVIEKYAGVFRRIDFAIIDSSHESNKNYSIFKKTLDGLKVKAPGEVDQERNDENSSRYVKQRSQCLYGVECRLQYSEKRSKQHNAKYSHPCRWSELCKNQDKEPHYIHEPHKANQCRDGDLCKELVDPLHRAKYRHENWPDFLIPCRNQRKCRDTTWGHRVKYSHGELTQKKRSHRTSRSKSLAKSNDITGVVDQYQQDNRSTKHEQSETHSSDSRHHKKDSHHHHHHRHSDSRRQSEDTSSRTKGESEQRHKHHRDKSDKVSSTSIETRSHKTPCRYGLDCYNINDKDHRMRYSH